MRERDRERQRGETIRWMDKVEAPSFNFAWVFHQTIGGQNQTFQNTY